MIDIDTLPDHIGKWIRKSPKSYISLFFNGLVAVIHDDYISFGLYIPAGAHIKDVKVESNDDIINVLENYKLHKNNVSDVK